MFSPQSWRSASCPSRTDRKTGCTLGQDQGATRYSTLDQITTANVARLKRAWTFHTGDKAGFFESTPIVVDSVMYFSAGNGFYAVDAVTGTQIWKVAATRTTRRGVSYWPGDAATPPRIIASAGTKLLALDAKTGQPAPGFGTEGAVELDDTMNSPAAIYKDLAIVQGGKPVVRAWNIRTGALVWTFNLIAQPGDPGHDTWEGDSWKNPGDTNVWGYLSIDAARGLVFLPNSMPGSNDYYGGTRRGDNLYGNSVVAVDAATGKMRWYRQLVHHDIWDYDLGAAPALVDVIKDGKSIPAVAQITKMGLLFVLDRTTGEPVWGIEERPVPQSTAPGEKTSPTQPFPVKPAPLARNSMTKSDLATITPEHEAYCKGLWNKYAAAGFRPVHAVERQARHRALPGRGRRRQLERCGREPAAGPDVHECDERGAVGAPGADDRRTRPARRTARRARRATCGGPWGSAGRGRLCTAAGACERRRGAGDADLAQGHARGAPLLGSGDDVLVSGAAVG